MNSGRKKRRRLSRPRLRQFNLRKATFALPSLFTLSSVFCGFYAVLLATGEAAPEDLYRAGLAVFFGIFFDMADGRVARMTRTQSEFGIQLDSLADMVTFGVAPAVIVYRWAFSELGLIGAIGGFIYVACGAIRLARFNVTTSRSGASTKYFIGSPIPLAGGLMVSMVMFHQRTFAVPASSPLHILALVLVISYLMVSNVRYRTFKDATLTRRSIAMTTGFIILFAVIAIHIKPTFALLAFFWGYLSVGLIEEVVFFRRRRLEAQSSPVPSIPQPPQAQPPREENNR